MAAREWPDAHQDSGVRIGYDLDLISNFTFFLDDPVRGDQREQVDHRFVTGARAFQKRQSRWGGRPVENTFGVQFRNDDVMQNALHHTEARERLETWNDASALVTSAGVYAENQVEWARWLRTTVGLRADGSRYSVTNRIDPRNGGTETAGIISPKGTAEVSDIDHYFVSRLPAEPVGGVDDIHVHPAVPRTLRVSMVLGF